VGWSPDHYNWITRNKLRFGRCTTINNVCVMPADTPNSSWAQCVDDEAAFISSSSSSLGFDTLGPRTWVTKPGMRRGPPCAKSLSDSVQWSQ